MEYTLLRVKQCITMEINSSLMATYLLGEVFEALNGMGPTKGTGSDGFPTIFYQPFWDRCEQILLTSTK